MNLKNRKIENPFFAVRREGVSIKDEAFLIILNIGTLGALLSFVACIIGKNYESIPVNILAFVPCFVFCLLCRRNKNIKFAKIFLICLIGIIVFPFMYMYSGGINSGMFLWFILIFCLSTIVLDGNARVIICSAIMLSNIISIVYCYIYPEQVKGIMEDKERYADTIIAFLAVVFALSVVANYVIRRMEEINIQLTEAKKEAELAAQAKSMFLASMSHEIRTPLNAVLNLNSDILYSDDMEEIRENMEDVRYSAKVLAGIINDVLDFSKIEQGKYTLVEKDYETKDLISHINMLGIDARNKGIEYKVEKSEENPLPQGLKGDDERIKQIITKLVSNAIKYTEKGQVSVAVDFIKSKESENEGLLKITVSDTGVGIDEKDLSIIFEAFERADLVQNIRDHGTGLGLAISKAFIKMMNGEIKVDTEVGRGTTFIITIPQKVVELASEVKEESFDLSDARILVCDDNEINLRVFTKILSPTNAKVTAVFSGEEALKALEEKEFDVIYMDYQMPQMDGMECMKIIKERGIDTPVIVLTADDLDNPSQKYLNMGFDDYLLKPINRSALYQKTKEYLLATKKQDE